MTLFNVPIENPLALRNSKPLHLYLRTLCYAGQKDSSKLYGYHGLCQFREIHQAGKYYPHAAVVFLRRD